MSEGDRRKKQPGRATPVRTLEQDLNELEATEFVMKNLEVGSSKIIQEQVPDLPPFVPAKAQAPAQAPPAKPTADVVTGSSGMPPKVPSAKEIRAFRVFHGIPQGKLAKMAGASRRTWSRWESGESRPTLLDWAQLLYNMGQIAETELAAVVKEVADAS